MVTHIKRLSRVGDLKLGRMRGRSSFNSSVQVQVPTVRRPVMEIPVLIGPVAGNGYRARCGEPLPITAEGKTRDEALANLRRLVEQRVAAGPEVAALRLRGDRPANPWVEFAAMDDPDNPVVRDWEKPMAEHRRKIDEHPE